MKESRITQGAAAYPRAIMAQVTPGDFSPVTFKGKESGLNDEITEAATMRGSRRRETEARHYVNNLS